MKKLIIAVLVLVLSVSLAACGRKDQDMATTPSTTPQTTDMPFIPDPTLDTNIPDPSVDTQMPIYTEGTDPTNHAANSRSGR